MLTIIADDTSRASDFHSFNLSKIDGFFIGMRTAVDVDGDCAVCSAPALQTRGLIRFEDCRHGDDSPIDDSVAEVLGCKQNGFKPRIDESSHAQFLVCVDVPEPHLDLFEEDLSEAVQSSFGVLKEVLKSVDDWENH